MCSRSEANQLAKEKVNNGAFITTQEMIQILNTWKFKENTGRRKIVSEGRPFVYSDTFGIVSQTTRVTQVSTITASFPEMAQCINKWAHFNYPQIAQFPYTSINVNGGVQTKIHRDTNNEGCVCIVGIGDYTKGELLYWQDETKDRPLALLSEVQPEVIDIHDKPFFMDAKRAHATNEFKGCRYSLVFHTNKRWNDAKPGTYEQVINAGFKIPSKDEVQRFADQLPAPKGYPKCTANVSQSIAEMTNFCQWEVAVQQTPWAKMARGLCRNHRREQEPSQPMCYQLT